MSAVHAEPQTVPVPRVRSRWLRYLAVAGPGLFRGRAVMAGRTAGWDLAITGGQESLRPLRPLFSWGAPVVSEG